MLKKLTLAILLSISTTSLFSQAAAPITQIKTDEVYTWTIDSLDDGIIQILGPEDKRKFIVHVAEFHHGKPADSIIVECNAGDNDYKSHEVAPRASITCYPHFSDTISVHEDSALFKNGSEGTYEYEPL
jgi:hypothetical protein